MKKNLLSLICFLICITLCFTACSTAGNTDNTTTSPDEANTATQTADTAVNKSDETDTTINNSDETDTTVNNSDETNTTVNNTEEAEDKIPQEYEAVITSIINAFPWENEDLEVTPEFPELSFLYMRNSSLAEVGFSLTDLDNNGQPELILADIANSLIYDLFTIADGKAIHLFAGGEKNAYFIRENGYIENQWSDSAAKSANDFYIFENGKLSLSERITLDALHAADTGIISGLEEANESNCYFKSVSDNTADYQHITAEEADEIIEKYHNENKLLTIKYTSFEEYKN